MGPLPPGKRGLVIAQLRVEGIVRQETSNKMIAVVVTSTDRAYFLHENDEVYNGVVSKITPDSVYFSENFRDVNGRMATRQVVKRLGSGPGENR
jgi:type II secretory pathway component PulC